MSARDEHLGSADFLDVENHPEITSEGARVERFGDHDYLVGNSIESTIDAEAILNP